MKNNESCILEKDFKKTDKLNEIWLEKRTKKENIYIAIKEYIKVLEKELEIEDDLDSSYLIQQEINKLKNELKKYYAPSILEMAKFEKNDEINKTALEKSKFQLVKKIK